jgi:hypothetical protein
MLIAFTILAIVSGSLFQMFFVSAHNNAIAVEMDTANGLAITAAELFKAGKGLDGAAMFEILPEAVTSRTWRSVNGERYVKYYDGGWREVEMAMPAAGFDAEVPAGSRYVLEAELAEKPGTVTELNYVAASLSLSLDAEREYRLVINEGADGVEAVFNGMPKTIDALNIGSVFSVNFEFSEEGALPKHIAVVNRTGRTVNVNVFGVPGGDGSGGGEERAVSSGAGGPDAGGADRSRYIEVSPVTGSVSVMYLGDEAHSADNILRTLTVKVSDLAPGGSEIARVEASVYIPG